MVCNYLLNDGPCSASISIDNFSYSGYTHNHRADWMHWASPVLYNSGESETHRIFKLCAICGKPGPDNREHILYFGHKFIAIP